MHRVQVNPIRRSYPSLLGLIATAGLLWSTGCESFDRSSRIGGSDSDSNDDARMTTRRENPRTAPIISPRTATGARTSDDGVTSRTAGIAYESDRPRPDNRPAASDLRRNVAFTGDVTGGDNGGSTAVGLYGELVSNYSPVPGQYDGSGNLSQITAASEGACFDPDSNREGTMIVLASTQHRRTADIYVRLAAGKTMTQITSDPADDVMPTFAPNSDEIAFTSNRDGNWNIYVTSLDGGPPVQLTSDPEQELHPSWSPDGTKIVYCKLGMQSGQWELWTIDLQTRIQQFLDYGLFPQWNPDPARSKIVFQRARERGSRLFSVWTIDYVNGEAYRPTEIVSAANAATMHPAWAPDGSRIVFVTVVEPDFEESEVPQQSDIWVVNVDGTSRTNLTNGQYRNLYPEWCADGTVYFLSDRSGIDNIWSVATSRTIDPGRRTSEGLVTVDPAETHSVDP